MFSFKNKYYFIIESTKDINLKNIKKRNKFIIVYRNSDNLEHKTHLMKFRNECKIKSVGFYVANNINLAIDLNSDGLYLSSYNRSYRSLSLKKTNFRIIGSAHSSREIFMKVRQGCREILFSKLFKVNYDKKSSFLGVIKFNNYLRLNKYLIPLGGINHKNLNSLNSVKCIGFALMSEIKKKPTKIISRLF
tara:strand:+ start:233 stop:805 length:573 start_codon:yes stop_codon:yes gene_type:complete